MTFSAMLVMDSVLTEVNSKLFLLRMNLVLTTAMTLVYNCEIPDGSEKNIYALEWAALLRTRVHLIPCPRAEPTGTTKHSGADL